ncbi:hypothetical protein [Streptomyces sp. CAU 1734]|uniref:hypothetical protein n=1 Tax=Streptomyces sp. CAU 1734 TaxID=3140360 RepID=UPI003260226E
MRPRPIALRTARMATLLATATAPAVLVLAPAAGAVPAHDSVTVTAYPADARPGDEAEVRVQGCAGGRGTARSKAFDADADLAGQGGRERADGSADERSGSGRDGRDGRDAGGDSGDRVLIGTTTLKSRVGPGTYDITVRCDGHDHRASGTIRIAKDQPARRDGGEPTPVAPVRAGGGGTAPLAHAPAGRPQSDAHSDSGDGRSAESAGPGTPHTVIGLVLAGVAAVAVAVRSSRRRRPGSD